MILLYNFKTLKVLKLYRKTLKTFIEGYYCQNSKSLKAINTPTQRKVLDLLRDAYPNKLTIQQISGITHIAETTVDSIVNKLAQYGFLYRGKKERTKPGKARIGKVTGKKPAQPYSFEDLNFISNKGINFEYQFAPGSVQYNKDFKDMYEQIADGLGQDQIYPLLVRFLEEAFIKISQSSSAKVRSIAPEAKTEFICSACGFNHEVRDFIRAMLLHFLDQLEISSCYIEFLKNQRCISSERYDQLQKLSLELKSMTVYRKVKNITTIRILSITKQMEDDISLFFGINQDSNSVCGVIDSVLLLSHGIVSNTMIECEPTVIDSNKYGIFYVRIFQTDYLKKITDEMSFPTFSKVRSEIRKIKEISTLKEISTPFSHDLFVVDAIVVEEPITSERYVGGNILQYIDTVIADGIAETAKIRLVGQCNFANDLHEGDRIRVVGACAIPQAEFYGSDDYDYDYQITNIELRLSHYGSIIKSEKLSVIDNIKTEEIIQKVQLNDDKLSRLLANVEISKNHIKIVPDKTIASALFSPFIIGQFQKIIRKCQFELLAGLIGETEMFTYEFNNDDSGTSLVIFNYRDRERLEEVLGLVKWTLARLT